MLLLYKGAEGHAWASFFSNNFLAFVSLCCLLLFTCCVNAYYDLPLHNCYFVSLPTTIVSLCIVTISFHTIIVIPFVQLLLHASSH
jgi:hypothetical protein